MNGQVRSLMRKVKGNTKSDCTIRKKHDTSTVSSFRRFMRTRIEELKMFVEKAIEAMNSEL